MLVTHGADLHALLPLPVSLVEEFHHDAVSPLPVQLQRLRGVAEVSTVHHVLQDLWAWTRCPLSPRATHAVPPTRLAPRVGFGRVVAPNGTSQQVRMDPCSAGKDCPGVSPPGCGQNSCPAAAPPGWSPSWSPPWSSDPPAGSCAWTCPWPTPGQAEVGRSLSLTPSPDPPWGGPAPPVPCR